MKKCSCGKEPELKTNQPEETKSFDENVKFRMVCSGCNIKTSFYKTMEQAEIAWDNKGWLNKRRAA